MSRLIYIRDDIDEYGSKLNRVIVHICCTGTDSRKLGTTNFVHISGGKWRADCVVQVPGGRLIYDPIKIGMLDHCFQAVYSKLISMQNGHVYLSKAEFKQPGQIWPRIDALLRKNFVLKNIPVLLFE